MPSTCTQAIGDIWDHWCQSHWFPTNSNYQYQKQHRPCTQFLRLSSQIWICLPVIVNLFLSHISAKTTRDPSECVIAVDEVRWLLGGHRKLFSHWTWDNKQHKKYKTWMKNQKLGFEVSTAAATQLAAQSWWLVDESQEDSSTMQISEVSLVSPSILGEDTNAKIVFWKKIFGV